MYRSFTFLDKFIPKYLILFVAIVIRTVFLISFSDSSLLVYRNIVDFCISILYPQLYEICLLGLTGFLVGSLGFCMCKIDGVDLTSSFLMCMPFISLLQCYSN